VLLFVHVVRVRRFAFPAVGCIAHCTKITAYRTISIVGVQALSFVLALRLCGLLLNPRDEVKGERQQAQVSNTRDLVNIVMQLMLDKVHNTALYVTEQHPIFCRGSAVHRVPARGAQLKRRRE
jgi:hypothetical protein